jgi:copper chaperone CopZ
MSTTTITVTGMRCGGCASSVREEIGNIPGVSAVDVDLSTGTAVIDSEGPVDIVAVENAVEEAGYQLASR